MIPTRMICNECGKEFLEFLKKLGKIYDIYELECPECGGYDTEVAE